MPASECKSNEAARRCSSLICQVLTHCEIGRRSMSLYAWNFIIRMVRVYFDIRPHRRRTLTVRLYSPGGANVLRRLIHASLDRRDSTSQRHVDRFSRYDRDRETDRPHYSPSVTIGHVYVHVVLRCGLIRFVRYLGLLVTPKSQIPLR